MDSSQKQSDASAPGITAGVSGVLRNLFGLLSNRIELAALELSEIRGKVLILLAVGALGMLFVWFALIYLSIVVAILAWPVLGWKILLLLTAFFALGALLSFIYLYRTVKAGSLSMPATMAELRQDRDALL